MKRLYMGVIEWLDGRWEFLGIVIVGFFNGLYWIWDSGVVLYIHLCVKWL